MSIALRLSQVIGFAAGALSLLLLLSFSLVFLMIALAGGAMVWAYLWWRTRKLRGELRRHRAASSPERAASAGGIVIEGEAITIAEDRPDRTGS